MAHYRTMLTSDNFMAADLWDDAAKRYRELAVKIVAVRKGEVVGEKGRKKGMPFVTIESVSGARHPKPLGLNATNCGTIASIVGSPDVERWIGQWITLYVTKTEAGREQRDCIRIRPEAPKPQKPADKPADKPTGEPVRDDLDPSDVQPEDRS